MSDVIKAIQFYHQQNNNNNTKESLDTPNSNNSLDNKSKVEWELSIRGGGHSIQGNGISDKGIVIDLSLMRSVVVNPLKRTVTAEVIYIQLFIYNLYTYPIVIII